MHIIRLLTLILLTNYPFISFSAEMKQCDTVECKKHFKKYKKYARVGYADAMSALGEFYYHGYGTDKNLRKSLSMFKRATKYGAYSAPVKVALLSLTEPSLQNIDDAFKYLKKAAKQNHPDANFLLGMMYYSKKFGNYKLDLSDKHLSSAYLLKHHSINSFIHHIKTNNDFTDKNFPLLTSVIETDKNEKSIRHIKKKSEMAKHSSSPDDIEIISIQGPTLKEIFTQQFEIFNQTSPERTTGTGTMISGRSCDEMISCSTVSKQDFKRMLNTIN